MLYDPTNIFAKILRGEIPCHKVYENEDTLAFMDIMPRTAGHVLVIPKEAARTLLDVSPSGLSAVARTVQHVARALQKALKPDGLTIQQFNEAAGGQEVFHLHVHLLPRWKDVPLKPHTGIIAPAHELADMADKIRACLV
jgi:histidine triad (HIT) family protein